MNPTLAAAQVVLKPRKLAAPLAGHPWILERSLAPLADEPPPGTVVDVLAPNGQFVARGIYNGRSKIRVRLYSWRPEERLDVAFFRRRLETALALRQSLGYDDRRQAARLVFSEADGLSGLIVDRYGDDLVVQFTALAMAQRLEMLLELLVELTSPRTVLVRTDPTTIAAEGLEPRDAVAYGPEPTAPNVIVEHGLEYLVDLREGQKTGAYLDQRENHRAAALYLRDRRVLDVCCYTGGFSLAAARLGGAAEVLGIDASHKAIEQARANAERNGVTNVRFETGNFFKTLERLRAEGARFDAIVLDPPRFASSRREIEAALRAYHRLNRLAVDLLPPGGILVTCSCSGRVTRGDFDQVLVGVGQKAKRDLQLLEMRGAAPDHPVRLACPETDYLKCLILRAL